MTQENTAYVKDTTEPQSHMKLPVHTIGGTPTGAEVNLDSQVFGVPKNDHVLYLAVKVEMANKRQGNHATLTRAMVRGGGRKPWRQKGRGAARAGTIRSPIWTGGGITFGPQPHCHCLKLPAKVKRLARKVALSVKASSGSISVIEDIQMDKPRTKQIAGMLDSFSVNGKSALLLLDGNHPNIVKSCRNIPRVEVRECLSVSTYDILRASRVFVSRSALDSISKGFAK